MYLDDIVKQKGSSPISKYFVEGKVLSAPRAVLDLGLDASDKEIKKSYWKLAKKYHPDKNMNGSEEVKKDAELRFKLITMAYEELTKTPVDYEDSDYEDIRVRLKSGEKIKFRNSEVMFYCDELILCYGHDMYHPMGPENSNYDRMIRLNDLAEIIRCHKLIELGLEKIIDRESFGRLDSYFYGIRDIKETEKGGLVFSFEDGIYPFPTEISFKPEEYKKLLTLMGCYISKDFVTLPEPKLRIENSENT